MHSKTHTHAFLALCLAILATALLASCHSSVVEEEPQYTLSGLLPDNFERVVDGDTTALYTLTNASGMEVCITNYGAHIVSLMVPGRDDAMRDVVLGVDSVAAYFPAAAAELGAIMGRYGGLLTHRPSAKSVEWMHRVYRVTAHTPSSLTLAIEADSTADGMPGTVGAQVDYTLSDDNQLDIVVTAIADATTPVDIAPRLFFNLDGVSEGGKIGSIDNHRLAMKTNQYLVRDSLRNYPGDMLMSIWTTYDFSKERRLGPILRSDFHQIKRMDGIECYFVHPGYGASVADLLTLYSPDSGIELAVASSFPGVDLYTANRFDGSLVGKQGVRYTRRCALAVMPHYYPDAPNMPGWGLDATIGPGRVFRQKTSLRFSVRPD